MGLQLVTRKQSTALPALILAALIAQAAPIDFTKQVVPILEQQCAGCHNVSKPAGALNRQAVTPGKPEISPLYTLARLPSDNPKAMPPGGPRLSDLQLATLRRWIEEGAEWPAGFTLKAAAVAPPRDELQTVRELHDRIQAHTADKRRAYTTIIPNTTVSYSMAAIPAGDFLMGSPDSDPLRKPDEQPQHKVHVDAFWMQTHEVTWDEYRLFMFANQAGETAHKDTVVDAVSRPTRPYVEMSFGMGINGYPAISMTQHAANKYAEWLSAKTGEFYRLPTEAEWEFACRAGTTTPFHFGNDVAQLSDYAWYAADSKGQYQKVATKKPNPWGLYDMLGNVMEWTLDEYQPYSAIAQLNPWVRAQSPYPQVVRGGSWNDEPGTVRCASRTPSDASWKQQDPQLPKSIWYHTDAQWLGFRLVRPARIPSAQEMFRYWNSGVERDE